MREVLERWKFSGINRKLQLKPLKWRTVKKMQTVKRLVDGEEQECNEGGLVAVKCMPEPEFHLGLLLFHMF